MEVEGGINNKRVVLSCEAIGTAVLLIAINWGGTSRKNPIAIGLTIFTLIQVFGSISGAHFNPAVTIAMYTKVIAKNN